MDIGKIVSGGVSWVLHGGRARSNSEEEGKSASGRHRSIRRHSSLTRMSVEELDAGWFQNYLKSDNAKQVEKEFKTTPVWHRIISAAAKEKVCLSKYVDELLAVDKECLSLRTICQCDREGDEYLGWNVLHFMAYMGEDVEGGDQRA